MKALREEIGSETRDDIVRNGQQIYDRDLRAILEPDQCGRFVAIEPHTRRYFLGDTGTEALIAARSAMPESVFYLLRIGYRAADTLNGYGGPIG